MKVSLSWFVLKLPWCLRLEAKQNWHYPLLSNHMVLCSVFRTLSLKREKQPILSRTMPILSLLQVFRVSIETRICSLMYCRCTRTLSLQFVTIRQATPNLDCRLLIPLDTPTFKTSHRRKILKELRCFCLKIGLS